VVVSPFEEEEEGTSIAREEVKVEGEDPATPGCLRETGWGSSTCTPAILNIGCMPPWLAEETVTPGP